jgi:streptomycin 6-kinase
MTQRNWTLPEAVQRKVIALGADGARWVNTLGDLVRELEVDWAIRVGAMLHGGSEALVAEAKLADGADAVIKLGIPGPTGFENEIRTLRAAAGRGYVRMLNHDVPRRAMLLERLGTPLERLGLSVSAQIEIICATLRQAWTVAPDDLDIQTGTQKTASLRDFIATSWRELNQPCDERAVAKALAFADARSRAFDPATSVLVHGDAHSSNTLQIIGTVPTGSSGFKFVDPDGMWAERACDLAVPMRGWSEELLLGDALARGHARCAFIAGLTGAPFEAIWQWGFLERMSTGLYLLRLGWNDEARAMLRVAEAWSA